MRSTQQDVQREVQELEAFALDVKMTLMAVELADERTGLQPAAYDELACRLTAAQLRIGQLKALQDELEQRDLTRLEKITADAVIYNNPAVGRVRVKVHQGRTRWYLSAVLIDVDGRQLGRSVDVRLGEGTPDVQDVTWEIRCLQFSSCLVDGGDVLAADEVAD